MWVKVGREKRGMREGRGNAGIGEGCILLSDSNSLSLSLSVEFMELYILAHMDYDC